MIDYAKLKEDILSSKSIDELKRNQNMPPVPACAEDQNYVFISYSHKDYKAVYCDLLALHEAGLRYWYDEGLPAGEDWDKVVEGQIRNANCAGVIFYLSENLFLSRAVNREVELTVGGGDGEGKNYFCINISGNQPTKILKTIIRKYDDDELEKFGLDERMMGLLQAFSDKSTYISKENDADTGHIPTTLQQIRACFNVIADGLPIANNEEAQKLAKDLEFAKSFAIIDGVLKSYMGKETEVIIPEGVTEIGEGAFKGRTDITRVVIPEGVIRIGKEAFCECYSLIYCNIPDSMEYIGEDAFKFCLECSSTSLAIRRAGCLKYVGNWIVGKMQNPNHDYDNEVYIGPETVGIAQKVFNDPQIVEISLPQQMKSIKPFMFKDYIYIYDITIPNGMTSIGNYAFDHCTSLEHICIPESVEYIYEGAFNECKHLIRAEILAKIRTINKYTFKKCSLLEEVIIPKTVLFIEENAFSGCKSLKKITIPNRVVTIEKDAFFGCKSLFDIEYEGTMHEWQQIATEEHYYSNHQFSDDEEWVRFYLSDRRKIVIHCTDGDLEEMWFDNMSCDLPKTPRGEDEDFYDFYAPYI